MAKKKNYRREKEMIKQAGKVLSLITGIDFDIGNCVYRDGVWSCSIYAELDVPDWFDTSIRDTAIEEIKPYVEGKYNKIITMLKSYFGEINYSHEDNDWYNFTFHSPPVGIAIPEIWENVDGLFQKVSDARLLTNEEVEENIKYWEDIYKKDKSNSYLHHINEIKWSKENWYKYFKFVGGSPFEDELFEPTHYAGKIKMRGSFSFKEFGEFIPSDGYMYYI